MHNVYIEIFAPVLNDFLSPLSSVQNVFDLWVKGIQLRSNEGSHTGGSYFNYAPILSKIFRSKYQVKVGDLMT